MLGVSPKDGDRKHEGGLDWVYQQPPGTWVVQPVIGPLGQKARFADHLRALAAMTVPTDDSEQTEPDGDAGAARAQEDAEAGDSDEAEGGTQ